MTVKKHEEHHETKWYRSLEFYLKIIEWGLCFAGCVLMTEPTFISFQSKLGETIVETAFTGGLISTSVFLLIYFWKEDRHLMAIITLFIYGVLNTISTILLIIEKLNTDETYGNYLIITLIAGLIGVIMVADFIRELKHELKH